MSNGTLSAHIIATRDEAREAIAAGETVFAVYDPNRSRATEVMLFSDEEAAWVYAERVGAAHVLDWETGDYA